MYIGLEVVGIWRKVNRVVVGFVKIFFRYFLINEVELKFVFVINYRFIWEIVNV